MTMPVHHDPVLLEHDGTPPSQDPLAVAAGRARAADSDTAAAARLIRIARHIRRMTAAGTHDVHGPLLLPDRQWPAGSRVMAACWPTGTLAVVRDLERSDTGWPLTAAFYVDIPDGTAVFVGRLSALTKPTGLAWRCAKCRLVADNCVGLGAREAERVGHESICAGWRPLVAAALDGENR